MEHRLPAERRSSSASSQHLYLQLSTMREISTVETVTRSFCRPMAAINDEQKLAKTALKQYNIALISSSTSGQNSPQGFYVR